MKKIYASLLTLLGACAVNLSYAQAPFNTIEYIDANNVRAAALVHGDMWWDPSTMKPACEYPKSAGTHVSTATGIWMSGYDPQAQLHVSAQTYRTTGNDYWPGPIDSSTAVNYATSQAWARIWKVNSAEISAFIADTPHILANIPQSILEWPAKGNPYAKGNNNVSLTITRDMAPFFDANNDGTYNPLNGDFPLIKGNQMLWWVFNDYGPAHSNTQSSPFRMEVKAMAYSYQQTGLLNNIVYYEFNITNKSPFAYSAYRFGIHADVDLGDFSDDFVGFDSAHRMGIVYNGKPTDGTGQSGQYGSNIPVAGVTMIQLPGDTLTSYVPAGSFMYYNNDMSGLGNPTNAVEYDHYLRSRFRDNTHLINDYVAPGIVSTGHGATGNQVNYVFPGNPNSSGLWSECVSGNPPGDRRFVAATGDMTFPANATKKIGMALVITNPGNTGCPNSSFSSINIAADTAWWYYYHPLATVSFPNQGGGNGIAHVSAQKTLHIYPNPANNVLYIDVDEGYGAESVVLYDGTGRAIRPSYSKKNNTLELNIGNLPNGIYTVRYTRGSQTESNVFVKR